MNLSHLDLIAAMVKNARSKGMNRDYIGKIEKLELDPIKSEDIAAFAHAIRKNDAQNGAEASETPPFFLSRLIFPYLRKILIEKDLKMNLLRMVHGQQEARWYKPMKAGQQVTMKMEIKGIYDTPAGEMIELSAKGYEGDELLVEGTSGFLVRKKKKGFRKLIVENDQLKELFYIDIQTDKEQPRDYARASRDDNLIHTSRLAAKIAGLPGTIMHGICVLAMSTSAIMKEVISGDMERLAGVKARFARPAIPGEKLTVVGYDSANSNEIAFEVLNPAGIPVIKHGLFRYRGKPDRRGG
ncbi:MAG: hypothetical protein GY754_14415 [bacterium]|nr:hypothetical protein [bacterium]